MAIREFESLAEIRQRREDSEFERGKITFVVGMQFGSEAKGSIVNHLAPAVSNAVRTGAANAGHTIYHHGEPHVMRQLPGAWTTPHTTLVLGAGAIISPDVLQAEIEKYEKIVPIRSRLRIDGNAHVIVEDQIIDEAKGDLAERIGSTSARGREGIGVAMADKILRSSRSIQAKNHPLFKEYTIDTSAYLNEQLEAGQDVMVEGTQGFGLSIDHGEFPFVTSRNATVSALADSIGVNPEYFQTDTIGVVRTFPIRVAGNSGPFAEGSEELTWEQMRGVTNNPDLPVETTSVTGLPRRIATFSDAQYLAACRVNRPTEIAVTFADYLDQSVYGSEEVHQSPKVMRFLNHLETLYNAPVTLVNTGPGTTIDFNYYRSRMLHKMG